MVRSRLKTKFAVPYGGTFTLKLPDKGMVGSASNFHQLLGKIREWRQANAIPVGLDFESEVERECCFKYPAECDQVDPRVPPTQIRITMDDLVAGTRNLSALKLAGTPLVDQAEANRRAQICSRCSFQSDYQRPCGGICQALKDAVKAVIGAKATPYDDNLRACRVCKCFNAVTVWVPLEYQLNGLSELQKEQFAFARDQFGCWKNPP